jgi:putative ABC transport system substrate-binding protein
VKSLALAFVALLLLIAGPVGGQERPARVFRIGFLSSGLPLSPEPPPLRAFREGLRELGYVEGRNLVIEARSAEGRHERHAQLLAELIQLKVDLLVVGSTPAALAAKKATTTVPVVFGGLADPVVTGVVSSLGHPGGNITGATFAWSGIVGKQMQLLKEAAPYVAHIAVLRNSANPGSAQLIGEVQPIANSLRVKVEMLDATDAPGLDRALAAIGSRDAQGIVFVGDPLFTANRDKLIQFAASKRLPAIYNFKLFAEAGGLMAFGGSLEDSFRKAASHADRILKGARPADLPVDQPTKFDLVVNLRTARALGLAIPQSLLQRADQVID